jgi:hypothetical protein
MSTTMAMQGGQIQQEQSDMCLVLMLANWANGGIIRTTIQEMQ